MKSINRPVVLRRLLVWGCIFCLISSEKAEAQKEYNVLQNWFLLRSDDNSLFRHLLQQSTNHLEKRTHTVAQITHLNDWKKGNNGTEKRCWMP